MKLLDIKFILKCLISLNLALVSLYLVSNHIFKVPSYTIRHWFDLNGEHNIPTWFSSIQLFSLFVLSIIYSMSINNQHLRNFYYLIGFVFLFLSADETAMIHEGITSISNKLSIHSLFPDAHGMWILVYPIILIVFLLIFWKGLLEFLNEKTGRSIFIIGSVVFVAGGVGLEVLGYYLPFKQGEETIINIIEVSTEESFEMLGQSLIIYALLSKIYPTQTNISKATKIF